MTRISFLVGFDRVAQSSPVVTAGAVESESSTKRQNRPDLSREGEKRLVNFWEKTRLGLIRRMREMDERVTIPEGPIDRPHCDACRKSINIFMPSQMKKRASVTRAAARRTRFVVHPSDPRKLYWDLFVGAMIIYSMVVIPWRICYKQDASGAMLHFELFVDSVFAADIILCFNTAFHKEDVLVCKRSTIARRYLSTWFVPDLLGTIPLGSLMNLFLNTVFSNSNLQGVKLLRIIRGTRMLKLMKLMRILRLSRKMENVDTAGFMSPAVVRLIKLLGKIVFAAHFLGCMWFMVNDCDVDSEDDDLWQSCGGDGLGSKYLASLYWTIATLMSVGYGDISADNNQERMFALGTMVIGSTAFGFIIAMVTVIVETMDPQATAKTAKMDEVREYMGFRKLSKALQLRIRKHFDHVYQKTSVFREVPILRDLPYALRLRLVANTHREILRTLDIVEGLDVSVVTEIACRLKSMQLKRKECLGKAGDVLDDVFFVLKGRVEGHLPKPGKKVLVTLHSDGSDFELSSLLRCRPMQFTYTAAIQTDMMWLDKDDLENIAAEYRTAESALMKKAQSQNKLIEECLSLEDVLDGCDHHKAKVHGAADSTLTGQVLMNWRLVAFEAVSGLVGDDFVNIVGASRSHDTDDAGTLIRTLRPTTKAKKSKRDSERLGAKPHIRTLLGANFTISDLWGGRRYYRENHGGDDRENIRDNGGGVILGGGWNAKEDDAVSCPCPEKESIEEEEQQKERIPPRMEEGLETAKSVASRWIIIPNVGWKQKWDIFCIVLIALSVVIVPFRIGFDAWPSGGWLVLDFVTDITFAIDILLNFRMAYVKNRVMVTTPALIASNYLRGWFTIDLLSTVPFDRIMSIAIGGGNSRVFRGLKLVKVVRMVRLLRLFRIFKVARLQVLAEEIMELHTVLFRGMKLVLTLAILGHFFGCFWSFVSLSEETADEDDSWTSSTWWGSLGLEHDDLPGRYIASIYWAFTTMTTVGYGDIQPVVDQERAYATIIMVIGATVFGYIVGSVSALASNPNGSQARETIQILAVSNYLDEKKVQQKLKQAVKKHVEYYSQNKSPFDEEGLQPLMPPSLRQETIMHIYKDVVGKIAIFKHLSPNHTAYILRYMKPIYITMSNYVFSPKNGSEGVYFLVKGDAEVVRQEEGTDLNVTLYNVQHGNMFGHEAFLQSNTTRDLVGKIGVLAVSDCSTYHLSETTILNLMDTQPDVTAKLQRALRRVIKEQEIAYSIASAQQPDASSPIGSSHFFLGGSQVQRPDSGSKEARSNGNAGSRYTLEHFIYIISRLAFWKGAKPRPTMIAPTEG